jgi:hypothetical protein
MPTDPERYVTAAELEEELPFGPGDFPVQDDTAFDNAMERALDAASESVEEWAGAVYASDSTTTTLSRPASAREHDLPLGRTPIQSVTSVTVDGDAVDAADYVVHDTHLELATADSGAAPLGGEWPTDRRSIVVEWTYGFTEVPAPVHEAIVRLARNRLEQIETDGIATEEGWAYRPPEQLKRECQAMVREFAAPEYQTGAMVV